MVICGVVSRPCVLTYDSVRSARKASFRLASDAFLNRLRDPNTATAMTFATALKISIACLAALAAEAVLAYYLFLNFAYELADSGQYSTAEAYATGPIGTVRSEERRG